MASTIQVRVYDDLKTNAVLSETFNENLRSLGITEIHKHRKGTGSVDIGNISNVCPTIHPYIEIADCEITGHSQQMVDATVTDFAHDRLITAAVALAYTVARDMDKNVASGKYGNEVTNMVSEYIANKESANTETNTSSKNK